jgi:peptidoglycan L-alanyl-D-glutamate endopeptidase CwlK
MRLPLLTPEVAARAEALIALAAGRGVLIFITEGYRTFSRQLDLFKLGPAVTKALPGQSWHNWGLAFDIAFQGDKPYEGPWDIVGQLGESLGLEWGGRWTQPADKTHFQLTAGYDRDQLLKLYPKGLF